MDPAIDFIIVIFSLERGTAKYITRLLWTIIFRSLANSNLQIISYLSPAEREDSYA